MSDQDEMRALKLPLAAMAMPHMTAALARWRDARGRRALASGLVAVMMPSESQADPLGLAEASAHSGLTDVLREPLDFRIRYVGAAVAAAQGTDLTGRRVGELEPRRFIGLIMETFAAVATGPPRQSISRRRGCRR